MKNKILIFIPAYNASQTLISVLDKISPKIQKEVEQVLVIDDLSQDDTYKKALEYKKLNKLQKLRIIRHKQNKGYDGTQKDAYEYAIKNKFDIVIMLHGDYQYNPEEINFLIQAFKKTGAGLVFGSRISGEPIKGNMPVYKFLGNKILTFIENLILGLNLSEYHSGFRLYSCGALKKIPFKLCSDNFHFDTEIIVQLMLSKIKIAETPISTHYGKEKCHVNIASYSYNILKTLMEYILYKHNIREYEKFSACLGKERAL